MAEPASIVRIEHPEAVAALFGEPHRRRLALLIREPRSAAEVAAAMGEDLRRSHHHLQRYLAVGLIAQVGERSRRGRPQRLYRSVAERFFVPPELFPGPVAESATTLLIPVVEEMLHNQIESAERTFERPRGRTFTLTEMGDSLYPIAAFDEHDSLAALMERYASAQAPAVWLALHQVSLSFEEAKRMQSAMIAMSKEIEADRASDEGTQRRYRLLLMMAPVADGGEGG